MKTRILFICLSWLIALTANAVNLNLYLTTDGLTADPNSTTPYYTTDTSIKEGTVVTIHYSGVDAKTKLSIYINGEVVSSGKILQMINRPYTFTAKKNCILRVEGVYAFNFTTNPNVYFTQDVDVTGVTLSQTEAAMTVGGETLTLTPTVAPDDATDKTVTWTSSDESVATVANGVVTAVAAGTATITATATNGTDDTSDDKTATCAVTVAAPATKYDLTKATGSDAHGTVTFTVGGNAATQAKKDDLMTVSVTPNDGYSAKDAPVRWRRFPQGGVQPVSNEYRGHSARGIYLCKVINESRTDRKAKRPKTEAPDLIQRVITVFSERVVVHAVPIKKNTKVTKKHPPSVTFNAQTPRFSQTFCTFAAE